MPVNIFHSKSTVEAVQELVQSAADANMNMVQAPPSCLAPNNNYPGYAHVQHIYWMRAACSAWLVVCSSTALATAPSIMHHAHNLTWALLIFTVAPDLQVVGLPGCQLDVWQCLCMTFLHQVLRTPALLM